MGKNKPKHRYSYFSISYDDWRSYREYEVKIPTDYEPVDYMFQVAKDTEKENILRNYKMLLKKYKRSFKR